MIQILEMIGVDRRHNLSQLSQFHLRIWHA